MKKIYISLPISGYDLEEREARCQQISSILTKRGYDVYHPFMITCVPTGLSERDKYAYYMGEDIKLIFKCDCVYFDDNWKNSKGCRLEHEVAKLYGIEPIYLLSEAYPKQ